MIWNKAVKLKIIFGPDDFWERWMETVIVTVIVILIAIFRLCKRQEDPQQLYSNRSITLSLTHIIRSRTTGKYTCCNLTSTLYISLKIFHFLKLFWDSLSFRKATTRDLAPIPPASPLGPPCYHGAFNAKYFSNICSKIIIRWVMDQNDISCSKCQRFNNRFKIQHTIINNATRTHVA